MLASVNNQITISLADEDAVLDFAQKLIIIIIQQLKDQKSNFTIYLKGDLGAGKTTLTRGMLHGLGYTGKVKSPTYTLVEEYAIADKLIFHFDLYRLSDPEELEYMGVRDYFQPNSICIIEWPEKSYGTLATPDLTIQLDYMQQGRLLTLSAQSSIAEKILTNLKK